MPMGTTEQTTGTALGDRAFVDRLEPLGRILDLSEEGWAVWCCAPIYGPDRRVHVFFARTPGHIETWEERGEIAHATADHPAGPYTVHGTVIKGRGPGHWDSHGLINPRLYRVDDVYALFYNAGRIWSGDPAIPEKERLTGIGLCISRDLWNWSYANGGNRVLSPSADPTAWDRFRCDNPSFLKHPFTGKYWLYYTGARPPEEGLRDSPGLAQAESLEGPYTRMSDRPVIDSSRMVSWRTGQPFRGFEDPHVWFEGGRFHMLVHDLGYDPEENGGWYFQSDDGIHWTEPVLGYHGPQYYWGETGRLETPLVLRSGDGVAEYLFVNRDTEGRATGFVFKIR
jgi:hypothetical protein